MKATTIRSLEGCGLLYGASVRPTKRSLAPVLCANICQGTKLAWCSMTVSRTSLELLAQAHK
eukprot:798651-Amphidinium_carterae.1